MIEAEENPYKSILVSMLNNIDNFSYDEVKNIDKSKRRNQLGFLSGRQGRRSPGGWQL